MQFFFLFFFFALGLTFANFVQYKLYNTVHNTGTAGADWRRGRVFDCGP